MRGYVLIQVVIMAVLPYTHVRTWHFWKKIGRTYFDRNMEISKKNRKKLCEIFYCGAKRTNTVTKEILLVSHDSFEYKAAFFPYKTENASG